MLIDLTGKTVLITDGSRGIGKACALLFASLNANVIITYDNDHHTADATLHELHHSGEHTLYYLDQCKPRYVERFFDKLLSHYPRLDILVNNAGLCHDESSTSIEPDSDWQGSWNANITTKLGGVANICYYAARHMAQKGGGKIINISAAGSSPNDTDQLAIAASKAGLEAMSRSLSASLSSKNITVHFISPGSLVNDLTNEVLNEEFLDVNDHSHSHRVMTADEVARSVAMYSSPGFEFLSGGNDHLGGDRYLNS
ncbi:SDR family oxidoreductase [Mucilaginibacter daejeonensis]|uniref:SDR family NAD(P)-dependent oxidoreductase n=1 Tax=Mucilaginibacter daejeonensis TaxID=398049 RepID=UPI001D177EA3|nr:SDR family oxidoreductase [Mucilaginibacter daejeonensis]UEG51988.1 SDR family oxidoreductase [Mucilaginibacter daejeonensis]